MPKWGALRGANVVAVRGLLGGGPRMPKRKKPRENERSTRGGHHMGGGKWNGKDSKKHREDDKLEELSRRNNAEENPRHNTREEEDHEEIECDDNNSERSLLHTQNSLDCILNGDENICFADSSGIIESSQYLGDAAGSILLMSTLTFGFAIAGLIEFSAEPSKENILEALVIVALAGSASLAVYATVVALLEKYYIASVSAAESKLVGTLDELEEKLKEQEAEVGSRNGGSRDGMTSVEDEFTKYDASRADSNTSAGEGGAQGHGGGHTRRDAEHPAMVSSQHGPGGHQGQHHLSPWRQKTLDFNSISLDMNNPGGQNSDEQSTGRALPPPRGVLTTKLSEDVNDGTGGYSNRQAEEGHGPSDGVNTNRGSSRRGDAMSDGPQTTGRGGQMTPAKPSTSPIKIIRRSTSQDEIVYLDAEDVAKFMGSLEGGSVNRGGSQGGCGQVVSPHVNEIDNLVSSGPCGKTPHAALESGVRPGGSSNQTVGEACRRTRDARPEAGVLPSGGPRFVLQRPAASLLACSKPSSKQGMLSRMNYLKRKSRVLESEFQQVLVHFNAKRAQTRNAIWGSLILIQLGVAFYLNRSIIGEDGTHSEGTTAVLEGIVTFFHIVAGLLQLYTVWVVVKTVKYFRAIYRPLMAKYGMQYR